MNDEKFDKLLKKRMQENVYIPEKINQLFSDFESEVNMKEKNIKMSNYIKVISIAACSILVIFFGGCTYAHVNGTETIISPLLRNLGINSKYEENATKFNDEVTKDKVKIKMLDGAIDDTTFIVGYRIEVPSINPDSWIEVDGEYKINDISVKPLNISIDKESDTSFIYYQIFDVNEIKIDDTKNVKINAKIKEIREYTEVENIDSAYAEYGKTFEDTWNFEEKINVSKFENSKTYKFEEPKKYQIKKNVYVTVTDYITGSYTNILKIRTDKTNYDGDSFEKYYRILDEKNEEIAVFGEEERQYDETIYNDRIISEKINKDSKITIEVYIKMIDKDRFSKVATIPVDVSNAIEKNEENSNWKQYNTDDYSFKYNENWILTQKLDSSKVGPNSAYLGALQLEIPSTTNSEYTSSIYVSTVKTNTALDEYVKQVKELNSQEYIEEKNTTEIETRNQKGYQVTSESTDGESRYVMQQTFFTSDGKIYTITFFGSEKNYNNLKSDINEFISSLKFKE